MFGVPLALASCAAPPTAAVGDGELARVVRDRAATLDEVERALELADVAALSIERPHAPAELVADRDDFWHACAFAWNPEVRRARRALLAARARVGSVGAPGPIGVGVDAMDIGGPERETDLMLTFDLLGLLRLGPASAARALSRAEERAAFAELENAVWRARFEVDRARMRVSGAVARAQLLQALLQEAEADEPRIEILARRGWVARAAEASALASVHMLEHQLSMSAIDLAEARAELARVAGLDAEHPALARVTAAAIEYFRPDDFEWFEPGAEELLARVPELRALRVELAVREAMLRREAAERWPMVRIGPQLTFMPSEALLGGVLDVELPFPGSVSGRVAAAVEERNAALDALESGLVDARASLAATRVALEQSIAQREEHAPEADLAAAYAWVAAQARFRVDPEGLERWWMTLRDRTESLTALAAARERAAIAALDYLEARGPRAQELAEAAP